MIFPKIVHLLKPENIQRKKQTLEHRNTASREKLSEVDQSYKHFNDFVCEKASLEINVSKPKTRISDGPKLKFNITLFLRKARDNIDEVWHVISLTNTCKPYDKTIMRAREEEEEIRVYNSINNRWFLTCLKCVKHTCSSRCGHILSLIYC